MKFTVEKARAHVQKQIQKELKRKQKELKEKKEKEDRQIDEAYRRCLMNLINTENNLPLNQIPEDTGLQMSDDGISFNIDRNHKNFPTIEKWVKKETKTLVWEFYGNILQVKLSSN